VPRRRRTRLHFVGDAAFIEQVRRPLAHGGQKIETLLVRRQKRVWFLFAALADDLPARSNGRRISSNLRALPV
jgi:hypothetical protein